MKKRLNILNIWVDSVSKTEALDRVEYFLTHGDRPHCVFAANPEKNFSVPRDPALYKAYREADLLLPDGIGIVAAARILHGAKIDRVPGSELIFDICNLAADKGYGVFLYGASEKVNSVSAEKLKERHPGLQIVGRSNGYVNEQEMEGLIEKINASEAEILFLALGSPKQELWFANHKDRLRNVKVCQGVGGTLDTIAGTVKRAPEFWQRFSLEWFYRLISEPKRIRRQKVLPLFVAMVLLEKLRSRNH
ncbi:glycosyltransferase, WecB/TagA/CpsF family [delta proteobacterium NaphS2]|nr:glycosyltransferase, WecB/TagA/CpsF family [delta proteobacterium NaphS2]